MKAFTSCSTEPASVGIVGMYLNDGSRKAEAGGDGSDVLAELGLPDFATGTERFADVAVRELSLWLGGWG